MGFLGLLLHRRGSAVEFEEQGRGFRQVGASVGIDRPHAGRVEELASGDGDAHADDGGRCADAVAEIGERAAGSRDALGDAKDPQGELGDDRERALGSHEQSCEVVARAVLARRATCLDHGAIGEHRGECEHVVAHRPVAHRGGAGSTCRSHATESGVRTGIDREEEAIAGQPLIERHTAHPRLHDHQKVIRADIEDGVHLRQIQAHPAVDRQHVSLER